MKLLSNSAADEQHVPPGRSHAVFVSDFIHLDQPFSEIARMFADERLGWLGALGRSNTIHIERARRHGAARGGGMPNSRIGVILPATSLNGLATPAMVVTATSPRWHDRRVIVPMSWSPVASETASETGPEAGLPELEGDLALSELDSGISRLSLSARYRTAVAPDGDVAERAAVHHVAESTMRRFIMEVAAIASRGGADDHGGEPPER